MKKIISGVMACFIMCGTAISVHAVSFGQQAVQSVSYDAPELEKYAEEVAVLVNKERLSNGLQPVKLSPKLSKAANIRAEELKTSFSHTRPDGTSCFTAMSELGITYRSAAENIAYGQKNPENVMNAWMNSSGHRANILNKNMEYIGVGVVYRNGVYYWSQFFASSDDLSQDAYLPSVDDVTTSIATTTTTTTVQTTTKRTTSIPSTTTTTVQTTETSQSTTKPVTTELTTAKPTATTQTTAAEPVATTTTTTHVITTVASTQTKPSTTVQTTTSKPITTEITTTTSSSATDDYNPGCDLHDFINKLLDSQKPCIKICLSQIIKPKQ